MPSLPTKVLIGGVRYDIAEDAEVLAVKHENANDECWAYSNKLRTFINLDPRMSAERKREVMLHECIHAVLYEWNIETGELPEEPLVQSLGNALLSFIRDNPHLIEFCQEAE